MRALTDTQPDLNGYRVFRDAPPLEQSLVATLTPDAGTHVTTRTPGIEPKPYPYQRATGAFRVGGNTPPDHQ